MNNKHYNNNATEKYSDKSARIALAKKMQQVRVITHNGIFHADDVFSIALLLELGIITAENQVYRAGEMPDLSVVQPGTYFIDIGGSYGKEIFDKKCSVFDHHGFIKYRDPVNKTGRYASFGLLWSFFGGSLLTKRGWRRFDETFACRIDAHDNGDKPFAVSHLIGSMNPLYGSFETEDSQFWKAVRFARDILKREIAQIKVWEAMSKKAPEIVEANLDENGEKIKEYIVLKEHMPILSAIGAHPKAPSFVIYPTKRRFYNVHVLTGGKIQLPKEWWGADESKLPEGCSFCHDTGFLLAADTKANAIAAAELAIAMHEESVELEEGDAKFEITSSFDFEIDSFSELNFSEFKKEAVI